jgi:DNA-binding ferritin-like protein
MDIIKLDVPLFIRLLELAREEVKQDADLHDVAEAVIQLSQNKPATMADYNKIVDFMGSQGQTESSSDPANQGEYDREGEMAQQDLSTAEEAAEELRSILTADENLPEWVQAKITKAVDYLDTARDYMKSKDEPVDELARIKQLGGISPNNINKD